MGQPVARRRRAPRRRARGDRVRQRRQQILRVGRVDGGLPVETRGRRGRRLAAGRARAGSRAARRARAPAGTAPASRPGGGRASEAGTTVDAGQLGAGQRVLARRRATGRRGRRPPPGPGRDSACRTPRPRSPSRCAGRGRGSRAPRACAARSRPDLGERLLADVAAGDRQRDARHDVAVGAHVAGVVAGAARDLVEVRPDLGGTAVGSGSGLSAGSCRTRQHVGPADAQRHRRAVAVVARGDHGVDAARHAEPRRPAPAPRGSRPPFERMSGQFSFTPTPAARRRSTPASAARERARDLA